MYEMRFVFYWKEIIYIRQCKNSRVFSLCKCVFQLNKINTNVCFNSCHFLFNRLLPRGFFFSPVSYKKKLYNANNALVEELSGHKWRQYIS